MKTNFRKISKKKLLLLFFLLVIIATVLVLVISRFNITEKKEAETQLPEENVESSLNDKFSFFVASDMRKYSGSDYDTDEYFAGAAKAMSELDVEFMIIPGDLDPVGDVSWTVEKYLGEDFIWYPVVGNHELPNEGSEDYEGQNMQILRESELYNVSKGPVSCEETTYSFDWEDAHFAVINQYCNDEGDTATDGLVSDVLYKWLLNDLEDSDKKYKFVVGHEPAFPQPDSENGRERHYGDSLDQYPENRDKFWQLLVDSEVAAYFCGHTHNYSVYEHEGVWQVDSGHARGIGDEGAKSTFMKIDINAEEIEYQTYRMNPQTLEYELYEEGRLQ